MNHSYFIPYPFISACHSPARKKYTATKNIRYLQSAWVAQVVEHLTLGFSSGHDLGALGLSPMSGSILSAESACSSLCSSSHSLSISLSKISKQNIFKKSYKVLISRVCIKIPSLSFTVLIIAQNYCILYSLLMCKG